MIKITVTAIISVIMFNNNNKNVINVAFIEFFQNELQIEAVAVGAILSDYQRIRVENVCGRLNLVSLAYLWRRDQTELIQEMINCQVYAIIIKV